MTAPIAMNVATRVERNTLDLGDYQLIARIDEPCHPSTRLAEQVQLRGWILVPDSWGMREILKKLTVQVLLEEKSREQHPLRGKSSVVGVEVERAACEGKPYFEHFEFGEDAEHVDEFVAQYPGRAIAVGGVINVSALIPNESQNTRNFFLTMVARFDDFATVSNSVEIALPPVSEWGNPYGGFLYPDTGVVASDYLAFEGWALKRGDRLRKVELFLNDRPLGDALIDIWSPEISLALPDTEYSERARFSKTLSRAVVADRVLSKTALSDPLVVRAHCLFESGATHLLLSPDVLWKPAPNGSKLGSQLPFGDIERVVLDDDGRLLIEGWAFAPDEEEIELFLSGVHRAVSLDKSPSSGVALQWFEQPRIVNRYLPVATNRPYGFRLTLNPLILGRTPGLVKLYANSRTYGLKPIGSADEWRRVSRIIRDVGCRSAKDRVVSYGCELLSSCGLRKKPEAATVAPKFPLRVEGRVAFAMHNLAATEGAPRVMFDVARYLRQQLATRDVKEAFLVLSAQDGALRKDFEAIGAEVKILPELSMVAQSWDRFHSGVAKARALLQEHEVSQVYANVIDSFSVVEAGQSLNLPVRWLVHESASPLEAFPQLDPRLRTRFLHDLALVDQMVFVCEATRQVFAPYISKAHSRVVPNGVNVAEIEQYLHNAKREDIRAELGISPEEIVVSIIGTTTWRKGQDRFLEEMRLLKERFSSKQFRFFIVGARDGEFLESLYSLVYQLGLEDEVVFVPETKDVGQFFVSADVLVVASREESAPLVSLEAFAYEVPLVSTRVFGLAEQIRDGENALAFELDKSGTLAGAIGRVLSDDALRARLVDGGKRTVREQFSLERSMKAHVAMLTGVA